MSTGDRKDHMDGQGAVHKITCCDCEVTYFDVTGRNLKPRLTEHKRATKNGDPNNNNNIAEHRSKTKHTIDWYNAKCLTYCVNYYQRLTLESWCANLEQTKPLPTSICALKPIT